MSEPTSEQVKALAEAMWYVLDDMGAKGKSVCEAVKARARIAYEPFLQADFAADPTLETDYAPDMTLAEAQEVMRSINY